MDELAARKFLRNFWRRRRHSRTVGFLRVSGVAGNLRIDPFLNLFPGRKRKIDEAHTGAFFRFSNPIDFAEGFYGFVRARKLKAKV
jgi:hypothetical protein